MKYAFSMLPLLALGILSPGTPQDSLRAEVQPAAKDKDRLKADLQLVEGNNQFAVDLYRELARKPGNKFFSPYSISSALAMTYAGAKGNTAKEMAATLHFTLDQDDLHPAFGDLIRKIQGTDKKRDFQLTTANSLWGSKDDLTLNPKFLRITQTDYQAGFHLVDILKDPDGVRKQINAWVEDKTKDKIKDLIKPKMITDRTRLVLVNAIYFKASWMDPFPKNATKPADFAVNGGQAVKVPTMSHVFHVNLLENDEFQLAQMAYQNDEVSMAIVLPRKKDGLAGVEKKLSAKMLQDALAKAKRTSVSMHLPKFKLTEEFSLGDDLQALGMKDAFILKVADFTGMEEKVTPGYSLFISKVVHKAFVDVHEEGTEAAAATAVIVARPESLEIPVPPVPFNADHPFLFMVRHNATGSILFMGRVNYPRG